MTENEKQNDEKLNKEIINGYFMKQNCNFMKLDIIKCPPEVILNMLNKARQQGIEIGKKLGCEIDTKLVLIAEPAFKKAEKRGYNKGVSDTIRRIEEIINETDRIGIESSSIVKMMILEKLKSEAMGNES
jgi:hypothetical protein